jgi:hypothetical protein
MSALEVVVELLATPGPPPDAARYRTLFHERVVANPDPNQDDLLFFVRKRSVCASVCSLSLSLCVCT